MAQTENIAKKKSISFVILVVNTYRFLTEKQNEFVLSKQLLRSGTSIGANLAESEYASSKKDFLNKLYIALKECNETLYWLDLLYETKYIDKQRYENLCVPCSEIRKILVASTKTIKNYQNLE